MNKSSSCSCLCNKVFPPEGAPIPTHPDGGFKWINQRGVSDERLPDSKLFSAFLTEWMNSASLSFQQRACTFLLSPRCAWFLLNEGACASACRCMCCVLCAMCDDGLTCAGTLGKEFTGE